MKILKQSFRYFRNNFTRNRILVLSVILGLVSTFILLKESDFEELSKVIIAPYVVYLVTFLFYTTIKFIRKKIRKIIRKVKKES